MNTGDSVGIGWPIGDWQPSNYSPYYPSQTYYYQTVIPPTDCYGEIHVFSCPRCAKCKCGKATKEA